MNQLEDLEALSDSVRLRAYGQRDPLVEYKNESRRLFKDLLLNFETQVATIIFKIATPASSQITPLKTFAHSRELGNRQVGRNDPCPCGSGKKYKKCHGYGN